MRRFQLTKTVDVDFEDDDQQLVRWESYARDEGCSLEVFLENEFHLIGDVADEIGWDVEVYERIM